ncbi:hypothetical protein K9U39_04450 [Rhodoblastus acidophilus]|uniref:Tetratricopeptide repeat protein n=1 Tax=Candidatus Rhodoblastus alkanivorans TaxID=2954117 RepID=A0ABS9Z5J1_9HYPH|nr:hypothetical protein [Candidatus Rhodoblastus alkanivorans]MCI4678434.1 hypothetical protein [Candidatus Rhodoblastus alkanivorans]MCI4682893.1 hypothetical protein [Candidatus Rhodoblastus alkanivorans]MDI4640202.1 hypothetical protein [Rhodoblastus acidophilus]
MFQKLRPPGKLALSALAVAFAAGAGASACAQTPGAAISSAAMPRTSGPERRVDESALRYYASSGQTARAQAELRRLRRLYPDWTPPDLNYAQAAPGGEDEQDLWNLYGAGKLDELRQAIAERRKAEPGWEPSADLRAKLAAKLFRNRIVDLAKSQRFGDIVQMLKDSGAHLEGVDIDVLWTIAEAYQKSRLTGDALTVYKTILQNETDPPLRLATVQKAMGSLRMDQVEQLLAMAHKDSAGKSEFDVIAPDIARARIAAFLHDERQQQVDAQDLKIFGDFAHGASDPNQPALLGWYYYKLKLYAPSLDWFKFALARGGDAMVAHGLALSLRWLGKRRETEEVAYAWRKPLVNNSILFIDTLETDLTKPIPPYIEPARLTRYGEVTLDSASGEGAQALAWYAYNSCQFGAALQWFERAVAWRPKEGTVYGYALTLMRLKKRRDAVDLINRYDGLFPKVVALLFPDGRRHPPTPCDDNGRARRWAATRAAQMGGVNVPGAYTQDPARQYVWGRVAGPDDAASGRASLAGMPKIRRTEFPIHVGPENPLRFAAVGQPSVVNAAVGADPAAKPGGYAPEPRPGGIPLVAHRVPGVGPMPYERYGFALLPGYNGVTTASAPTAAEQIAPAGTLWALERREDPVQLDSPAAPSLPQSVPPAAEPLAQFNRAPPQVINAAPAQINAPASAAPPIIAPQPAPGLPAIVTPAARTDPMRNG